MQNWLPAPRSARPVWVWLSDEALAAGGGWLGSRRSNVRVVNEVKVAGKLSRTLPVAPFTDFHIPGSLDAGGAVEVVVGGARIKRGSEGVVKRDGGRWKQRKARNDGSD